MEILVSAHPCGICKMPQWCIVKLSHYRLAHRDELCRLLSRKAIQVRVFTRGQMAEDAAYLYLRCILNNGYHLTELFFHKAQPVHSGIELDMDRVVRHLESSRYINK